MRTLTNKNLACIPISYPRVNGDAFFLIALSRENAVKRKMNGNVLLFPQDCGGQGRRGLEKSMSHSIEVSQHATQPCDNITSKKFTNPPTPINFQ